MSLLSVYHAVLASLPTSTVPTAPTGLTAVPTGASRDDVLLSWTDNSSNETGFKVEYSTDNSSWSLLTTTAANATSYTHTTPDVDQVMLYYRVRATNLAGDSSNATAQIAGLLFNLFGAWELESTSYLDSAGSYSGTGSGTLATTTGKLSTGISANANANVTRASNSDLQAGDVDWAFAQWVQFSSTPAGITMGKSDSSSAREWHVTITSGRFRFLVYDGTNVAIGSVDEITTTPSSGTWYHVVGYHNAAGNQVGVRVNANSFATSATTGTAGTNSTAFGIVGRSGGGATVTTLHDQKLWWKGRIPSTAQWTALYNSGAGLAYPFI